MIPNLPASKRKKKEIVKLWYTYIRHKYIKYLFNKIYMEFIDTVILWFYINNTKKYKYIYYKLLNYLGRSFHHIQRQTSEPFFPIKPFQINYLPFGGRLKLLDPTLQETFMSLPRIEEEIVIYLVKAKL